MQNKYSVAISLLTFPTLVLAHPGHGLDIGFASGFMHPLSGWDHFLMMLAVGVWAAKVGGNARWQLPLTFMLVMAIGAGLGMAGFAFSGLETAIATTVIVMGMLLIVSLSLNTVLQIGLVALFAMMHGLAHGAELHHGVLPLIGMLLATALLHIAGVLLGSQRIQVAQWMQTVLAFSMILAGSYGIAIS